MKAPNLSAWALRHPQMVLYLMGILLLGGVFSYLTMGRDEDPVFSLKIIAIQTYWPGATAREMEQQVTNRIEQTLQEMPHVDEISSMSRPGESQVILVLSGAVATKNVPEMWSSVRHKLDDLRPLLPEGVSGPYANDEFDNTDVLIYALTSEDHDLPRLRHHADRLARELKQVPAVKKVHLLGVRSEKIYVEVPASRLAALGIAPAQIFQTLGRQNTVTPAGFIDTTRDRVQLSVSGALSSVEDVQNSLIAVQGRQFRLGDIATVRRGLAEPGEPRMRLGGQPAVGIAVVMADGANVVTLGADVARELKKLEAMLPRGIEVREVSNQAEVVRNSTRLFITSLLEAILVVLAVSFFSLGWRTGLVVALSIPLVLGGTLMLMQYFDVTLHRISFGSLIIALGLLVDDAIIAVEMMVVKMEQGLDRFQAATFAYTSTAFPMLSGTLVTAGGFLPIFLANSNVSEYAGSMFVVVTSALLMSWIVAVVFTPYLGYRLLDSEKLKTRAATHGEDIYDTPFYRRLNSVIAWCVDHRWRVIIGTLIIFALSLAAFGLVQRNFFPISTRLELLVHVYLPQGSSLQATEKEVAKIEKLLEGDPDVLRVASYVGVGAPRFILTIEQQLPSDAYAQLVITSKSLAQRDALMKRLQQRFDATDGGFGHLRVRVNQLAAGPSVGYPVQFGISGEDVETVRRIAGQMADIMRASGLVRDVNLDWNEKAKAFRIEIDQARAQALGVSTQEVAQTLQGWLQGAVITRLREDDRLIDVVWRAPTEERSSLEHLPALDIITREGRHVPLAQVAHLIPVLEEAVIGRRDRLPTIIVRADVADPRMEAPTVSQLLDPRLKALRAQLPPGYRILVGGIINESAKMEKSIFAVLPVATAVILTLVMMQMQSFSLTTLVMLSAPLGMIGVTASLLLFQAPYGFVANLGVIALTGMIIRNSLILVDQIQRDEQAGKGRREAIIGATVRRFRPITLTAVAAMLAMVPLTRQLFWGPMAIAIMGGLLAATALTCLFLPALYAAWFRVGKEA
ncbi:efflux RND transporter permease subunit [Denitratisoma oestradiolicum]|nr:efflux RND transporter permease subunit [Denitratisoma oestradiolicum]TWO79757.1 multidrug transporter AcrB [Denitratisoma oestradiolicum]